MKLTRPFFVLNYQAGYLTEIFMVNAVFAIVAIRVFLYLTGYPQLGGDGLHIAHMLWGGLLMLLALGILLLFIDGKSKYIAAIVGGLGWGAFIDEIGKFVTSDNDYFFKPSFAIMYLLFVLMFVLVRVLIAKRKPTSSDYFANALDMIKNSGNGFSTESKQLFNRYVKKSELSPALTKQLSTYANSVVVVDVKPDMYSSIKNHTLGWYKKISRTSLFGKIIAVFFLVKATLVLLGVIIFVIGTSNARSMSDLISVLQSTSIFQQMAFFVAVMESACIVIGAFKMRTSYMNSLQWFRISILISIFFGSFFNFYFDQLLALLELIFNILILYYLNFALYQHGKTERLRTTSI